MSIDEGAFFLDGQDVASALRAAGRVYLVGHLQREQEVLWRVGTQE